MGKSIMTVFIFLVGMAFGLAQSSESTKNVKHQLLISANQSYRVRYQSHPAIIPLNQSFDLEVWIKSSAEDSEPTFSLWVDARMPEHRHGMVRQPKIIALGQGHFRVTGMLFHMPGRWELYFDITRDNLTERARVEVFLE